MIKAIPILTIILSSSFSFAVLVDGFKRPPPGFDPKKQGCSEIQNMPRIRSQDSFGLCFAFSSATIIQWYLCKTKNIDPCSDVEQKKEVSPLQVAGWANRTNPKDDDDFSNHNNIVFGGTSLTTLGLLSNAGLTFAESCYPFDQVVNKYGKDAKSVDAFLSKLEKMYNKKKTEGSVCEECLKEAFKTDLLVDLSIQDIRDSLVGRTFGEFLGKALLSRCEQSIKIKPHPIMNYYPDLDKKPEPKMTIEKIKTAIMSGYPVAMSGMCVVKENGDCKDNHSAAISGYCSVTMPDGSKRELVKVHNSWGKEWQDSHNDGWVDGTSLVNEMSSAGSIAWWTIPEKK